MRYGALMAAGAVTLGSVAWTLSSPFWGRMLDRRGPRVVFPFHEHEYPPTDWIYNFAHRLASPRIPLFSALPPYKISRNINAPMVTVIGVS